MASRVYATPRKPVKAYKPSQSSPAYIADHMQSGEYTPSKSFKKRNSMVYEEEDNSYENSKPKRVKKAKAESDEPEEKRLRRHRARAPVTYLERLNRVRTQRMFLINRNRTMNKDRTHEEEVFDIAGSTGA